MKRCFLRLALTLCLPAVVALSGCTALTSYYDKQDAPEHVRNGEIDPRLKLTRTLGEPLAPVIRNINAPYGRLQFARGLEQHLRATLKPLDVILVRSRPAMTQLIIPSHFTHAAIWLGTEKEMRALGAFTQASVRAHADKLVDGNVLYEAAEDEVRIVGIDQIINTDEIVIMRLSGMTPARARAKYAALFSKLGTPFDYNFDYLDKSRLTCTEIVASAFPEISMPVRYSTGRFAVIPDDVARRALTPGSGIRVIEHIVPEGFDRYTTPGKEKTRAALSAPKPKPAFATMY